MPGGVKRLGLSLFLRLLLLALLTLPWSCSRHDPLPKMGQVPEFELVDQAGKPFGTKELAGAPYLVAFMFTRCPSICPRVSATMREIGAATERAGRELRLVSISVDGEYDTPQVLTAYAKKHDLSFPRHVLLTGDSNQIADSAEQNFKIAVQGKIDPEAEHLGITHGSHLVLVDGQGSIRGYYRSTDENVAQKLVADLEKL
jgi:protein SCO1/2